MKPYTVLPSLLSADLLHLGQEVQSVLKAGTDWLHLDVMDNHYVPNLTFGPLFCQSLRRGFPQALIDVHLMASPVDALIESFAEAGARRISIHPDACIHLDRSLALIKHLGCQAGLVLNPATSLEALTWSMHHLDFILVMTVNPGFGGQTLIQEMIEKIRLIHTRYPQLDLCVDGGVTEENIALLAQAGANQFVMGTAFFHSKDYQQYLQGLHRRLEALS